MLGSIKTKITTTNVTITYPMSLFNVSAVCVSEYPDFCDKPQKIEANADSVVMTHSLQDWKPLLHKALYYERTNQAFALQQLDALGSFLSAFAAELSRHGTVLGLLSLLNVYYNGDRFRIFGFLPEHLLRYCTVLYHGEQDVGLESNVLNIKVIMYYLLTARTPAVPFLASFPIADARIFSGFAWARMRLLFAASSWDDVCSVFGREAAGLAPLPSLITLGCDREILSALKQKALDDESLAFLLTAMQRGILRTPVCIKKEI